MQLHVAVSFILHIGTQYNNSIKAFYNPSKSGGIEVKLSHLKVLKAVLILNQLTARVPDVTASDTNFPFEVKFWGAPVIRKVFIFLCS